MFDLFKDRVFVRKQENLNPSFVRRILRWKEMKKVAFRASCFNLQRRKI